MPAHQLEFETIASLIPSTAIREGGRADRRRSRASRAASDPSRKNTSAFIVALSSALRAHQLTHQIYDVLVCVALLQVREGHATIPGLSGHLGCSRENIHIHIHRNRGFFIVEQEARLRITLSQPAIKLLGDIKNRIDRTHV